MINMDMFTEKAIAFGDAWEKVSDMVSAGDLDQNYAVGKAIDENYTLIAAFKGEFWGLVANETNELIFYYTNEDEWTFGDILGGYLDFYFTK